MELLELYTISSHAFKQSKTKRTVGNYCRVSREKEFFDFGFGILDATCN